jgi:hypothetical protein
MYAYKYDENKYYAGQQECQIDPLESKKQGHPVYLLPANCTWQEPLTDKEGYKVKWNGNEWKYEEIPVEPEPEPPTLDDVKEQKINELKAVRDAKEMEPVLYAAHKFDFDSKSYERITAAIYALDMQGATSTINWTLADNGSTPVTANDLRGVIAAAAVRSDALHTTYRALKAQVQAAETVDDVNNIMWPED